MKSKEITETEYLSKEDFEVLFEIDFMGINDPEALSPLFKSKKQTEHKLLELEKRELIKIERREGKIYGSQLTEKGKEIFEHPKHKVWKEELGY